MRFKSFASIFFIYLLLIFGLTVMNCGERLGGVYSVSLTILKNCDGIHKNTFENFMVEVKKTRDGNIVITPLDVSAENLLNGTGTITTETLSFEGSASGTSAEGNFNFTGKFEGNKMGASYGGVISEVSGRYKGCYFADISFFMRKK